MPVRSVSRSGMKQQTGQYNPCLVATEVRISSKVVSKFRNNTTDGLSAFKHKVKATDSCPL